MKRNKHKLALFLLIFGVLSSQDCNEDYTFIDVLPETATILSGDSCLFNDDLKAVLEAAFKKHDANISKKDNVSSDLEVPAFIAEHQKKRQKKQK